MNLPAEGRDHLGQARLSSSVARESLVWDLPVQRKTNRMCFSQRGMLTQEILLTFRDCFSHISLSCHLDTFKKKYT